MMMMMLKDPLGHPLPLRYFLFAMLACNLVPAATGESGEWIENHRKLEAIYVLLRTENERLELASHVKISLQISRSLP